MPRALSAEEFSHLMSACGPFEAAPQIAVAVSGGADSLALAFLAHEWAGGLGGRAVALTVDHGLRPGAAAEAAQVGHWLKAVGIEHQVLRWQEPKPGSRVQEAARNARYDLMTRWCREHDVLHLLLGHHQGDQAETFLMRKARGSGPEGLAGMRNVALPPGAGYRWPRLLRPLLPVTKGALEETLEARGRDWICDPSNENLSYERVRVRKQIAASADPEARCADLAAEAAAYRRQWDLIETRLERAFADHASLSPYGYGAIRRASRISDDLVPAFWSRLLRTVGGRAYPPRGDRLTRFLDGMRASGFKGAAVAGSLVRETGTGLLVMREPASVADERALAAELVWDRRFLIRASRSEGLALRKLGEGGVRALNRKWPGISDWTVPPAARRSLPALFQDGEFVGLPAFAGVVSTPVTIHTVEASFVPATPLVW